MIRIRAARRNDLESLVSLTEARRVQLERWAPLFWRKADRSASAARAYLRWRLGPGRWALLGGADVLVAEGDGEVLGCLVMTPARVPPVYSPGPTRIVDDLCVRSPDLWSTVGALLLSEARGRARARGARQLIVPAAAADVEQQTLLQHLDLRVASAWWSLPL